jgi:hypothetical protein
VRKKAPEEKYVTKRITFPPEVWQEVEQATEEGERSAYVVQAVRERLERQNASRITELEERVRRLEQA